VEEVQRRLEDDEGPLHPRRGLRGQRPGEGFNQWVKEWKLQTEPWTFLVNGKGTIVDRFEGTVSVNELETAVRGEAGPRSVVSPSRSTTMFGTRAIGLSERIVRTSATMSSGEICSSSGGPVHSVIRVATNPGEIAVGTDAVLGFLAVQ
jgi:hypothetical protein